MAINYPNNPNVNDTHIVGSITWTWNGTAWAVLSTVGGGGGVTYSNSDVDTHLNTGSAGTNEILSWDGSDYIWVADQTGDGGGGGGEGGGEGGGASEINDLTDVNISNPQDNEVLKYSGGSWVNGTDATGGAGSVAFTDLSDAPTGVTPANFYESAIATLRVTANGTSAYKFDSHYSGDNPTIFVLSGTTIAFDLADAGGHPFLIQDSTGTNYSTGLVHVATNGTVTTGSNAQGKSSGVLYWRVQETLGSPPNYRYQCQSHIGMVGAVTIKRLSSI